MAYILAIAQAGSPYAPSLEDLKRPVSDVATWVKVVKGACTVYDESDK